MEICTCIVYDRDEIEIRKKKCSDCGLKLKNMNLATGTIDTNTLIILGIVVLFIWLGK